MENLPLTEYTIAGIAIGAIVWLVKAFLSHLKNKDIIFTETINNHMNHVAESNVKLEASHSKLSEAITRLIEKL